MALIFEKSPRIVFTLNMTFYYDSLVLEIERYIIVIEKFPPKVIIETSRVSYIHSLITAVFNLHLINI